MYDFIPGKLPTELTLIIEGKEIIVESASLIRTIDTCADAFTSVVPWQPGLDLKTDEILKPYSYSNARIYIGGILQAETVLYNINNKTNNSGTVKELEGFSKTADIIDSCVFPPYEVNNITLTERCRQQCKPFGINVIVGADVAELLNETRRISVTVGHKRYIYDQGSKLTLLQYNMDAMNINKFAPIKLDVPILKSKLITDEKRFPRIVAEPTDKIFDHLSKLAAQRGVLLSCTKYGDLLITRANLKSPPVGTIDETTPGLAEQYEAKFNGRNRFAVYRSLATSAHSKHPRSASIAKDPVVKTPRFLTFNANDDVPGNGQSAAEWRKNKTAADAVKCSFPVNSWYAPNGKLWEQNTTININSQTMAMKKGFTFLITRVEFKYSNSGLGAILELKPPTMYSNTPIVEPWAG
jgi:prophage tail gpP-like protein